MLRILAAGTGILWVGLWPDLPPLPPLGIQLLLGTLLLLLLRSRVGVGAALLLGIGWGIVAGHQLMASQLPAAYEKQDFTVIGEITSLPEPRPGFQRFRFQLTNESPDYSPALPRQMQLSWYGRQQLAVGERWRLRVRLRQPRGSVNQGGFDYQRWLLSEGIGATGYVREAPINEKLGQGSYPLQRFRSRIRQWLSDELADSPFRGPLTALAIGDRSAMSPAQWDVFRSTGTSHLMAISGLHVGLVALFGFWCGLGLRALSSFATARRRWPLLLPALLSCLAAAAYAAVAGFALPTQRALIMVVALNLAVASGRVGSAGRSWAWAWLIVLLIDPLAGYDMGFWLSFGAVFCLLFYFRGRRSVMAEPGAQAGWARFSQFGRAQGVVFVGLLVPLVALNLPISWLAPVANLVMIPLVSFAVALPLLLSLVFQAWWPGLAEWLLALAEHAFGLGWGWLAWLDQVAPESAWFPLRAALHPALSGLQLVLAAAGALLLLLPRGVSGRWLGVVLLLPLLLPLQPERSPLKVTTLDVGQGLAVVVQTRGHTLVYDTGAAVSERFNVGEAILVPYLRSQGVDRVDTLIVSHGDNDHAGGAEPLLAALPVTQTYVGEPLPALSRADNCDRNIEWQWDDVRFALIEPNASSVRDNNNRSCILLIRYGEQRILLPGDIEAKIERQLLADDALPNDLTVLVAPHHGSHSSSTQAFTAQLTPRHVVYSAGFRNRYGHPHPRVVERYRTLGAVAHYTARAGQIDMQWNNAEQLTVRHWRQHRRRYWFSHHRKSE